MLVLSRKKNQSVLIKGKDGDVRIVLLEADKGKIRLGIEAPRGYTILREEVLFEILQANRESALDDIEGLSTYLGGAIE